MRSATEMRRQRTGSVGAGRVLIVADDLTGACDSGVAFLKAGRAVRVVLDAGAGWESGEGEVLAVTTETRNETVEAAVERVSAAVRACGDALVFKKVDSAARGHFAAEIVAALESSGMEMAVVAPAFAEAGRTVVDGVLRVRDIAGQARAVALRELFGADGVRVLPRGELEEGLRRAAMDGVRVAICDAVEQEDLERLVRAVMDAEVRVLWAGSAGLAKALAGVLPAGAEPVEDEAVRRQGGVLVFVGTPHPVTEMQVGHLRRGGGSHQVVDFEDAERVRASFAGGPVAGLVMTGGDTAAFVLRALGATGIRLRGEIAAGMPWGVIEGGMAEGCVAVTKSGGFGGEDALVRSIEFCEGRTCERV
jgi:uncharacterized protein YgbK (DUF1537 family)